jgi:hypothetical protein
LSSDPGLSNTLPEIRERQSRVGSSLRVARGLLLRRMLRTRSSMANAKGDVVESDELHDVCRFGGAYFDAGVGSLGGSDAGVAV